MTGDTLAGNLDLQSPSFGEFIPEMETVCFTGRHENMRRSITYIIAGPALQSELAEIRLCLSPSPCTQQGEKHYVQ
jgi:hypothetical protein